MRSTLFYVPHEIAGIPLFGVGIALGCVVVGLLVFLGWGFSQGRKPAELLSGLPVWAIAAAIVWKVLPMIEQSVGDQVIGLPIRGYGVMVLAGLIGGVAVTSLRGSRVGVSSDTVIGLGFWMMLGGVAGARIFFVVQKWSDLAGSSLGEKLIDALKVTEGGLVIYGGVIGGLLAGGLFCRKHKLPVFSTADLVAPGFLFGLCFGRLGCLLHGCCFGGICTADLPTISFPAGSVPYEAQVYDGRLLGLHLATPGKFPSRIVQLEPDSPAARAGVREGDVVKSLRAYRMEQDPDRPAAPPSVLAEVETDRGTMAVSPQLLPDRTLPMHPSQIYASINALLLAAVLWFMQPVVNRDGVVFSVGVILYAGSRFLLEGVRSDEAGQLGTNLTIAQWVGAGSAAACLILLVTILRLPPARRWLWR